MDRDIMPSKLEKLGSGLDFIFNKLIPKKLVVILMGFHLINKGLAVPDFFWGLLITYVGGNVATKFVPKRKDQGFD